MKTYEEAIREAYWEHKLFIHAWCNQMEQSDRGMREGWSREARKHASTSCGETDMIRFIYGKSEEEIHNDLQMEMKARHPELWERYKRLSSFDQEEAAA